MKGNSYRLIVKFSNEKQGAFIGFIVTHAEPALQAGGYDKIEAETI
ncbi:type II toxin-antitoxin system HigB family toxin [Psychroflexus torquis]